MSRAVTLEAPRVSGAWTQVATPAVLETQVVADGTTPFALGVKANIAVRGFARSAACPVLQSDVQEVDAPVVAALRAHGAVVVGTTNMHELAFGITSENAAFGAIPIPDFPEYGAGGSSGGSAAVVASGAVRFALGTDTGGSVSIPASHCGVVGFRPTTGRWPGDGLVGLSWTRDTPGIFASTVAEATAADSWVTDARIANAPRMPRLGVPREFLDDLDLHTERIVRSALDVLASSCELVEVSIAPVLSLTRSAAMPLVGFEAPRLLGSAAAQALRCDAGSGFAAIARGVASDDVAEILAGLASHPVAVDDYNAAVANTVRARAAMADLLHDGQFDGLLFPTTPAPAPLLGTGTLVQHLGKSVSTFELYTRHTEMGTVLAAPMVTVPAPVTGALPVGLTVQGARGADAATLALAALVESVLAHNEQ